MPYFMWRGVDLKGTIRKGRLFSRSESELDELLLKRDIALITCSIARETYYFMPIRVGDMAYFFRQLAVLLSAGVLLPDALRIVCEQLGNRALQGRVYGIVDAVHRGTTFSDALLEHKPPFTGLMIQMALVGEATGSLPTCLQLLADYSEREHEFKKKMRLALVVPGITLAFFLLIAAAIFLFVIPHFAHIFKSVNHDMPTITRMLVQISAGLRSWYVALGFGVLAGVIGLLFYMKKTHERFAGAIDAVVIRLPFIGDLSRYGALAVYLQSLALLLEGGIPLVVALQHAQGVVANRAMRAACKAIAEDVRRGSSLVTALSMQQESIGDQELVSLVAVAEESGQLARMLGHAAHNYHDRVQRRLSWMSTMVQPIFMIIVGLLVALLIFAVYLPIFSLANVVG